MEAIQINHYDHSNTPGARKRRKAAQRRWTAACIASLIGVIGAAQAVSQPVSANTAEYAKAKPAVQQVECIEAVPGVLPKFAVMDTALEPKGVTEPAWFEVEATAYCSCAKCCGEWAYDRPGGVVFTADGSVAQVGVTIAADWDVFPAGTVLYIEGLGERIVQDRGGAINGMDVDVYFDDHQEALEFGRQHLNAYVVS